jgi:hypothetical protein
MELYCYVAIVSAAFAVPLSFYSVLRLPFDVVATVIANIVLARFMTPGPLEISGVANIFVETLVVMSIVYALGIAALMHIPCLRRFG